MLFSYFLFLEQGPEGCAISTGLGSILLFQDRLVLKVCEDPEAPSEIHSASIFPTTTPLPNVNEDAFQYFPFLPREIKG